MMCDCHPLSAEDKKLWERAKARPRTKAEWQALHNMIESYKRLLIDHERLTGPVAAPPADAPEPR